MFNLSALGSYWNTVIAEEIFYAGTRHKIQNCSDKLFFHIKMSCKLYVQVSENISKKWLFTNKN